MRNFSLFLRKRVIVIYMIVTCVGCADLPQVQPPPAAFNDPLVIDLEFDGDFTGTSNEWKLLDQTATSKFSFEISKYQNIDSIIFKASLRSERESVRCVVDIYNLTDDMHIEGSSLFSRIRYELHSIRSGDIQYGFPNKEVLLGVRIKSEEKGNHIEARHFSLLIYYH